MYLLFANSVELADSSPFYSSLMKQLCHFKSIQMETGVGGSAGVDEFSIKTEHR